jgi:hypothetical protein
VAAGRPPINAILVLQTNKIDIAEIQEIGSIFIGGKVALR